MSQYPLLRNYAPEIAAAHHKIIDRAIHKLPFSLAYPVDALYKGIGKEDYDKAMIIALDFIEVTIQWLSMFLLVKLINHESLSSKSSNNLLKAIKKIDTKRPLSMGDWINEIFIPLAMTAKTELHEDELSKSLVSNLFKGSACTLLGDKHEPSIVKIRNEYKGHSTTLSQDLYRSVVYTIEPHIISLLNAVMPLCDGEFASVDSAGIVHNHQGVQAQVLDKPQNKELKANHYYVTMSTPEGEETYDLFPLIYSSEEDYIYIFQTLGEDNITYISSNINAPRVHHDNYNDAFDKLLQQVDKSFDISKEKNWDDIQQSMTIESKQYLERVYNEKKYNRELFVNHRHLSRMLQSFYDSEQPILPLLGEAGQGKTNQLCYWAEEHLSQKDGVIIFSSSDFAIMTLEERIRKIFGYSPRRDIRKIIDMMHEKAKQSDKNIYIFFDALNECLSYSGNSEEEGPLALYNDIYRLFVGSDSANALSRYTNVKIVFTCRDYTWKSLFGGIMERDNHRLFMGTDDNPTTVRGFNQEELATAYKVYQNLYQMDTPFEELSRMASVRLKDPLVLKIASSNYLSRRLPEDIHSYASIALFDKMFSDMEHSYAGHKQGAILKSIGGYILDKYLCGQAVDNIPEDMLHEAYDTPESPLHELSHLIYKQDGTTVAYGELINRPDRPILRLVDIVGSTCKSLQFIYERFLEYVMACIYVERHRTGLSHTEAIPSQTVVESLQSGKTNVVFIGAMRNALIIDLLRTHDYSTLLTLIRDYSSDIEVAALVNDVCNTLICENYESEIFSLVAYLLDANLDDGAIVTQQLNNLTRKIDKGEANSEIIEQYRKLHGRLEPIIHLRQMAMVNIFNGLLLTDYFNESLYTRQPMNLVWRLVCDPIKEVGNDACLYVYYLNNRHHTLGFTPLNKNLTEYIVGEMYAWIKARSLVTNAAIGRYRRRMIIFLESAVRITTLLIIDSLLSRTEEGRKRVIDLLGQIRDIMYYISGHWLLIKILMPFLQLIMRTQITFQKVYVNNAIEYQCFWDDNFIQKSVPGKEWDRASLHKCLPFLTYNVATDERRKELDEEFKEFHDTIKSCYTKGDSFSYFVVERMLIVMGTGCWDNVWSLYNEHLFNVCHSSKWRDYSQMSLLYNLFHTGINIELKPELIELYAREAEDWTLRCRGEFKAPNSEKANSKGVYKRNVMSWYGALYCTHSGDNKPLEGDSRCVPLFYKLLDRAIDTADKELLFHLMENISELVTDFGFVQTALSLVYYILYRIDNEELLAKIDRVELDRDGVYSNDTSSLVGNLLSTTKNYYPVAVDTFLKRDIARLKFPNIEQYREDILNYNPSGETLSDLLTHKFGKFVVWSLMYEPEVNSFACRAVEGAVEAKSCFDWYDKTVRLAFKSLFKINV